MVKIEVDIATLQHFKDDILNYAPNHAELVCKFHNQFIGKDPFGWEVVSSGSLLAPVQVSIWPMSVEPFLPLINSLSSIDLARMYIHLTDFERWDRSLILINGQGGNACCQSMDLKSDRRSMGKKVRPTHLLADWLDTNLKHAKCQYMINSRISLNYHLRRQKLTFLKAVTEDPLPDSQIHFPIIFNEWQTGGICISIHQNGHIWPSDFTT